MDRPSGYAGRHVGREGPPGLGLGAAARLRPVARLHILALDGASEHARRRVRRRGPATLGTGARVRAIRFGRAAVAVRRRAELRRSRGPLVAGRPGLCARSAVPIRGWPILARRRAFLPLLFPRLLPTLLLFPGRRRWGRGPGFGGAWPLRRFGLAWRRRFGVLPGGRGRRGPVRTRLRPFARRRRTRWWAGRRAGAFLRRPVRTWATARGLAAPGAALLGTALCQQNRARRCIGGVKGRQHRQHRAGQEDQS
ncbi:hypothetical protein [Methylobacterium sp. J-026]|uniref:hypothetical protein n=1 Tax=Methylobacterium sp. J-026 TaxID=2836624 RepID=UPI00391C2F4D